jgi:hypothetical protein
MPLADFLGPDSEAEAKRQILMTMSEMDYQSWRHNPITAAYLQYLEDIISRWRELAADLLEAGAFLTHDSHEDRNPDVVRGKLLMARQLHGLTHQDIRGFYGLAEEADEASR